LGPNGEALVRGRSRFRCAYGKWGLRSGEIGPEVAGGKFFQGAEAVGEFVGGQAALTAEGAQEIFRCGFAFLGVATGAAGNEVAVGILASAGPAGEAGGHRSVRCGGVNFVGQEEFDDVASAGAFYEAQSALFDESAHSLTSGSGGEANAAGEPENRKTELEPPFEPAMPKEMVIDYALNEIEAQARHESIFDLFQDESGVGDAGVCFAVFHDLSPVREVLVLRCGECPKEKREQGSRPKMPA
jgi:hypothetical protein